MRTCKTCGIEKKIENFVKSGKWYRHKCKECRCKSRRTGKPRASFPKGNIPWNYGHDKSRNTEKYRFWRNSVLERDGYKCIRCGRKKYLHCDHIIPWKDSKELRYCISNGQTLCAKCHLDKGKKYKEVNGETTQFNKGIRPWNFGNRKENPKEKKCNVCNELKEINEFSKAKDWYLNTCKKCRRKKYYG